MRRGAGSDVVKGVAAGIDRRRCRPLERLEVEPLTGGGSGEVKMEEIDLSLRCYTLDALTPVGSGQLTTVELSLLYPFRFSTGTTTAPPRHPRASRR